MVLENSLGNGDDILKVVQQVGFVGLQSLFKLNTFAKHHKHHISVIALKHALLFPCRER
jgi:hypothetical protein